MKNYILGVDGGATKTHYALYDMDNKALEIIQGCASNHEVMDDGFVELEQVLKNAIGDICTEKRH